MGSPDAGVESEAVAGAGALMALLDAGTSIGVGTAEAFEQKLWVLARKVQRTASAS